MVTLRTYLLRGLLTALFWAAAIGGFASDQEEAFLGISERYPTGAPGISRAGLVAAYDMSTLTSDGSLRDFSVNGLHGRILGTRDTPGLWGSAMTFPTAADRVDLPETDAWAIDGPLSVLLWFRLDTLGLHQHIVACDDKFVVWLTGNNLLRFVDTLGDGAITREPFSTDRWYSVAGVFNGTKGTPLTPENIRGLRQRKAGRGRPRWPALHTTDVESGRSLRTRCMLHRLRIPPGFGQPSDPPIWWGHRRGDGIPSPCQ